MNDERTTTIDNHAQSLSSTQPIEKKNVFCEKIERILFEKQDVLDRPLNSFTAETVCETTEQLQTMLKALHCLPSAMLQELIPSYDAIIQGLQNTIVELTLALDQLSPPENKASFYTHLLLSQAYFADVFVYDLSDASGCMYARTDPAPVNMLTFPSDPMLHDFSGTILPDLYALIQKPGPISSTQYEQAIVQLQTLDRLLEKQKSLLKVSRYFYDDEGAVLHCQLVVILAYASDLLRQFISSLSTLQPQSHSKSRRTARLREEMLSLLSIFIHQVDDIVLKNQKLKLLLHRDTDRATSEKIIYLYETD